MVLLMARKLQNLRKTQTTLVPVPLSPATSNLECLRMAKVLHHPPPALRLLLASKTKCCCSQTLFLRNSQLLLLQSSRRIAEKHQIVLRGKRGSLLQKVRWARVHHSRQPAAKVKHTLPRLWIRKKGNCHQRMESLCLPALLLITRRIDPSIPTSLLTS